MVAGGDATTNPHSESEDKMLSNANVTDGNSSTNNNNNNTSAVSVPARTPNSGQGNNNVMPARSGSLSSGVLGSRKLSLVTSTLGA